MQFTSIYTNQPINTDDYLACFVDEYTGEVKEDRRVLEKRVRKLWFRSTMPKAVIHSDVKLSCQQLNAETPPEPSAPKTGRCVRQSRSEVKRRLSITRKRLSIPPSTVA